MEKIILMSFLSLFASSYDCWGGKTSKNTIEGPGSDSLKVKNISLKNFLEKYKFPYDHYSDLVAGNRARQNQPASTGLRRTRGQTFYIPVANP